MSIFKQPDLIDEESIHYRKGANLIVRLADVGLDRFCADRLMWAIGMDGKEAIGGHLYITNYRMIFVAHAVNRLTGEFSVPLQAIEHMERRVRFPVYKLLVNTQQASFEFVSWHAKAAMAAIEQHRTTPCADMEGQLLQGLQKNTTLCWLNSLFLQDQTLKRHWNDFMDV